MGKRYHVPRQSRLDRLQVVVAIAEGVSLLTQLLTVELHEAVDRTIIKYQYHT